jgi:vacuolar-type H+-ATPase subunit H
MESDEVMTMAPRLSDLLERIRPAGAPGAATETSTRRERDAADEIADVAAVLADAEHDAGALVAQARSEATALVDEAHRRAGRIRAGMHGRAAAEAARLATELDTEDRAERDRLTAVADAEIARLRADAERRGEPLVRHALGAVWAAVPGSQP